MHDIVLHTRKKKVTLQLPEKWAEVTPKQAFELMPLVALPPSPKASFRALKVFMNGSSKYLRKMRPGQVASLTFCVSWLWEEDMTEAVIPWFEQDGQRYLLPDAMLENITCLEWLLAEEYYKELLESPNEKSMQNLMGTLCREPDRDKAAGMARDDMRVVLYSRKEAEQRGQRLVDVDERVKLFVMAFFSGCKKWVHTTYKSWLFKGPEEGEENEQPTSIIDQLGWYGIFQNVAESGVFGNMENVLVRTKFKDVCLFLITKKEQYEEMKRKQKSNRNDNL